MMIKQKEVKHKYNQSLVDLHYDATGMSYLFEDIIDDHTNQNYWNIF